MKALLSILTAAGILLTAGRAGATAANASIDQIGPVASVVQTGQENTAVVTQDGSSRSSASLRQSGASNTASITQGANSRGAAAIDQGGGDNAAAITQGAGQNIAILTQGHGYANTASITQSNPGGAPNTANLTQIGSRDSGSITQNGSGNTANLIELGSNDSESISQTGANNFASFTEIGNNMSGMSIKQTGGGLPIVVTQVGPIAFPTSH